MADGILLAQRGVRAVAIITEPFRRTAEAMARRLGAPKASWVVTPHPVSSLSVDALRRLARELAPRVRAMLSEVEGTAVRRPADGKPEDTPDAVGTE